MKSRYVIVLCAKFIKTFMPIALLLGCIDAPAKVFYEDDQYAAPRNRGDQYASIGFLAYYKAQMRASGVLVDACHVLSAQHLVSESGSVPKGTQVSFFVGMGNVRGFEKEVAGTVVKFGGYNKKKKHHGAEATKEKDWILIRLNECVGNDFGYVRLAAVNPQRVIDLDEPLSGGGYPVNKDTSSGAWIDPTCNIHAYTPTVWLDDCANSGGVSGGPIFLRDRRDGSKLIVVAMHTKGDEGFSKTWDVEGSNEAVSMRSILPFIQDIIRP